MCRIKTSSNQYYEGWGCVSQILIQIYLKSNIITVMNQYRKTNRPLMPTNQNVISPDLATKYMAKSYPEPMVENIANPPLRDFAEIQDLPGRRNKVDDHYANYSLSQINLELDKNLDDIITLLRNRKGLMAAKKKRIMEDAQQKLMRARNDADSHMNLMNDQDFIRITNFCPNTRTAVKMLAKIAQTIPQIKGPRIDEEERSDQFWSRNRKLENDIDTILQKLKVIDKQLQKQNGDVLQICKELDHIEDTLKSFVGAKSSDHVQKVQPLFLSKKKNYDVLNRKIKDREISKDKKIQYIKRITNILEELKRTREERLSEIAAFFGIENSMEFDRMNFKDQGDFGCGLEELLKAKERNSQLLISEKEVMMELQMMSKDQDKIAGQLLKSLSDQAKAFQDFNSILTQRIKYTSILSIFENETNGFSFDSIDPKQYLKKFKEIKTFFKRFLEEDTLLKQGLMKTSETAKTFYALLRTTQSEKQRRQDLLGLLQACIRKRGQYEQKREQLRKNQFQQSRNDQEMTKYQQDLEGVLTDGDLDGYKKIGNAIGKCENQRVRLSQVKDLIEKQMQSMDRDMLSIANRIQEEYEDILSDVLPTDFEYSLRSGEDVKKLRNQLRKMYKRLGLLSTQ